MNWALHLSYKFYKKYIPSKLEIHCKKGHGLVGIPSNLALFIKNEGGGGGSFTELPKSIKHDKSYLLMIPY